MKPVSELASFVAASERLSEMPDVRERQVLALLRDGKISESVAGELLPRAPLAPVKS